MSSAQNSTRSRGSQKLSASAILRFAVPANVTALCSTALANTDVCKGGTLDAGTPDLRPHKHFSNDRVAMSSLYCVRRILRAMSTVMTIAVLMVLLAGTLCQAANPPACNTGVLPPGTGEDIDITNGVCFVDSSNSPYQYGNINIYGAGKLCFVDSGDGKNIEFWAKSILVESNGSLLSSDATKCSGGAASVFGASGATLTIHLYGPDQGTGQNGGKGPGQGILCHSGTGNSGNMPCGVPDALWNSNRMMGINPSSCVRAKDVDGYKQNLPGNVDDCFYQYMPLTYDDGGETDKKGYFG